MRTSIKRMLAFLLVTTSSSIASATSEVIRDPKLWDFAPLLYSHRIVRGTIVSTKRVEIPYSDLHPEFSEQLKGHMIPVLHVAIDVHEVLRGHSVDPNETHVILVEDVRSGYASGVEMLVCEYKHPALDMYYQGGQYGRYVRKRDTWLSEQTPRGERRFDDADIRAKIASMDLERVSSEAELILEGETQSVTESVFYGPDSTSAELFTLMLKVRSIEKGRYAGETIEIVALGAGLYLPEWRTHIPRSFHPGQRWICFLKKNEIGWYPFAGSNGLLRIEDDALVYDERVPFWHSLEEVREAARQVREPGR